MRLPQSEREAITTSNKRNTTAHSVAMYNAHEWYRTHPLDVRVGGQ
ncbi:hypothetical protein ACIQUM_31495 [Amycolatopsis azurea]